MTSKQAASQADRPAACVLWTAECSRAAGGPGGLVSEPRALRAPDCARQISGRQEASLGCLHASLRAEGVVRAGHWREPRPYRATSCRPPDQREARSCHAHDLKPTPGRPTAIAPCLLALALALAATHASRLPPQSPSAQA